MVLIAPSPEHTTGRRYMYTPLGPVLGLATSQPLNVIQLSTIVELHALPSMGVDSIKTYNYAHNTNIRDLFLRFVNHDSPLRDMTHYIPMS